MKIPTRILTEMVACIALAAVLYEITFYQLPQGGRITAASMVPLLFVALRRGSRVGIIAGITFGLIVIVLDSASFAYNPIQVMLDYPLAYGALGLAGFFRRAPILGVVVGIAGRFVCHFISGIIFFAQFAPATQGPYLYSAIYNGSYIVPELIISAGIIFVLEKRKILQIYM